MHGLKMSKVQVNFFASNFSLKNFFSSSFEFSSCCDSSNFILQIFLNDKKGLNAGLYEGDVVGRRRFGSSQVPHGFGIINYFTNDKFHRLNYTGEWVDGNRHGNGTTYFKDGSVYRGEYRDGVEDGEGTIT